MAIYTMSNTGDCPRAISALKLGNKPMERGESDLDRLRYYSDLEAVAADRLVKHQLTPLDAGECKICKNGRCGHHIEIEEDLFKLVGHLDRRVILPDERVMPVEIKSLGPKSWKLFKDTQFANSMGYAYQECCYLQHEKSPGIYWVMNRDSGEILKYIINDFNNEYDIPIFKDFTRLTLPVTYDQIIDKLNSIELDIQEGKLSDAVPNDNCFFCGFKYLCNKKDNKKVAIFVDDPAIKKATEDYKVAHEAETIAKEQKQSACNVLTEYCKREGQEQLRVNGVSYSYHGLKYTTTLDKSGLLSKLKTMTIIDSDNKKIDPTELLGSCEKRSKMFDSYTVKIVEESIEKEK